MSEPLYKIKFVQQDTIYEIYARYVSEESLMGFIEVEELIFSEQGSDEDQSEARLRAEFKNVKRCYLPMHTLLRIDEVSKQGKSKVEAVNSTDNNVSHFPGQVISLKDKEDK